MKTLQNDLCCPFDTPPWSGSDGFSKAAVQKALTQQQLLATDWEKEKLSDNTEWLHAKRVAWFVQNGWHTPISLSFSPQGGWPVLDGNHRLAAAVFSQDAAILANVNGWLDLIEPFSLDKIDDLPIQSD